MSMTRQPCLIILLLLTPFTLLAQPFFPVKVEKKWGLINASGQLAVKPDYDAIGDFKHYGYAVMQRAGRVGLLNQSGEEIVAPKFDDLKVLDSTLIAVMDLGEWMVINLAGKVVLKKGYQRLQVWPGGYIAFEKNRKWGLVRRDGALVTEPVYDDIQPYGEKYFITRKGESSGLLTSAGSEILAPVANEIKIFNDSLFFFRSGPSWGAVNINHQTVIPAKYETFKKLSDHYIKLVANNKFYIYSIAFGNIISQGTYEDYYAFSKRYLLIKKDRQLGLIDWCGNLVLQPQYDEIQAYEDNIFRASFKNKWGLVQVRDSVLLPFEYDYIAPLKGNICAAKKNGLFGIVNAAGAAVVAPQYQRIELEDSRARAYLKKANGSESLTLLQFDEHGKLSDGSTFEKHFQVKVTGKKDGRAGRYTTSEDENPYLIDKFEWFYSPIADRWGLRRLEDGTVQIEPKFHSVQVEKGLNFSLVGIEKPGRYEFERTTYRFESIYGLVNNEVGLLVTEVAFWDVQFEDFRNGNPLARCIFDTGKYGLVNRIGQIVKRDCAFVGPFSDGLAVISMQGRLSGSLKMENSLGKLSHHLNGMLSPNYMSDYTNYDQIFQNNAHLVCEGCEWGYVDTSGTTAIRPQFAFAKDFVNGVSIVQGVDNKWGMINKKGDWLIPCQYDGIAFLENTNNRIVRLYKQAPKYGLIDTLGQLAVSAIYEEIGSFSEGRLAVKRNGMWGFVNPDGLEVIPCRFREVGDFKEGLAAAKLGRHWGFIDKLGNIEIQFKYNRAGNFNANLAWVHTESGAGYINKKDEIVIEPKFDRAFDFYKGVARVVSAGKWGLIDQNGKFLLRPKYNEIRSFDKHGLAVVAFGNEFIRYGLINLSGNVVASPDFNQIADFREGLAVVQNKDLFGFIDTTGKLVISCIYPKVSGFSEGRAVVQKNGLCGYIDLSGKEIIPLEYSRCLDFKDGKAVVYKGMRKAGVIDRSGQVIIEPSIDRLLLFAEGRGLVRDESSYQFYYITEEANLYDGYYERATGFKHGVAVVQINGKWGIINQKGIEVIPPKYDRIESFENGFAKVRIEGFNGLSNLKGEVIAEPDYEFIRYAGQGLFRVEQGDKIGYCDSEGNWVWGLNN